AELGHAHLGIGRAHATYEDRRRRIARDHVEVEAARARPRGEGRPADAELDRILDLRAEAEAGLRGGARGAVAVGAVRVEVGAGAIGERAVAEGIGEG